MGQPVEPVALTPLPQLLRQRWGDNWLIGPASEAFWHSLERLIGSLGLPKPDSTRPAPALLMAEPDPLKGLAAILAGYGQGYTVVLANPRWGRQEWQQVEAIAQPDRAHPILNDLAVYPCWGLATSTPPELLLATGGSGGHLKFVRHNWATLMASVDGFRAHFGVAVAHAYCVLPLYHVSGLMQALRVLVSGGQLALQPYAQLKQGQGWPLPEPGFLSLVPTQLQWLLDQGDRYGPWLRTFHAVLLGGAAAWPSLLTQARERHIPLALTYGMTETASQVATLLPTEFLAGHHSSGRPLPHAHIHILNPQHRDQPTGQIGTIAIQARSLFAGYLNAPEPQQSTGDRRLFLTDDVGYLDREGYLHLLGRHSTKIITGGEKVFPEEVEAALLAHDPVQEACVVGLPDRQWGQAVCALVVLDPVTTPLASLPQLLKPQLAHCKRPKHWILLNAIPKTPQGKINRRQAVELAQAILGPSPDR